MEGLGFGVEGPFLVQCSAPGVRAEKWGNRNNSNCMVSSLFDVEGLELKDAELSTDYYGGPQLPTKHS